MAIWIFRNLVLLTPKMLKNEIYVIQLLVVNLLTKFQDVDSSIFDLQMRCFCLNNHANL